MLFSLLHLIDFLLWCFCNFFFINPKLIFYDEKYTMLLDDCLCWIYNKEETRFIFDLLYEYPNLRKIKENDVVKKVKISWIKPLFKYIIRNIEQWLDYCFVICKRVAQLARATCSLYAIVNNVFCRFEPCHAWPIFHF